jgi:hypothetical protein
MKEDREGGEQHSTQEDEVKACTEGPDRGSVYYPRSAINIKHQPNTCIRKRKHA